MSAWDAVIAARAAYERACHGENVANEVHAAAPTDESARAWREAREAKATAYKEYVRVFGLAAKSGEPHPDAGG